MHIEYIEENNLMGAKDESGQILVPVKYDQVNDFCDYEGWAEIGSSVIPVQLNGKWALRVLGEEDVYKTDFCYQYLFSIPECLFYLATSVDDKYTIYDFEGELSGPTDFDEFAGPDYMIMRIKKDGLWGLFCTADGRQTPVIFEEIEFDGEDYDPSGFIRVKLDGKWGYVDQNNEFTENEEEAFWEYSFDFVEEINEA